MSDEFAELAEEASIMMENEEMNNAADNNGNYEQGPVTPPEPAIVTPPAPDFVNPAEPQAVTPPEQDTEPSTSILNGPPTEEEGTDTFIGTDQTNTEAVNESDGEISSVSEKSASPRENRDQRGTKKRPYSSNSEKNGEVPVKQANLTENGTKTTGDSLLNTRKISDPKPPPTYRAPRRGPRTPELSDELANPLLKTLRKMRTMPLPAALDLIFSVQIMDVAQLQMDDMLEVLDLLKDLTDRREQLTENRLLLTEEVRNICNQEVSILTDLEHVMNPDERGKFEQLKMCPPSMDELCPFTSKISPRDVNVANATIRLAPVDLLPPPETPLIGKHEPAWDCLLKHIPRELRGSLPVIENKPPTDLSIPPPNMINIHEAPPPISQAASQPQEILVPNHPPPSFDQPPPNIKDNMAPVPTPVKSQVSAINTAVLPPPTDMSVPPPNLGIPKAAATPPTTALDPISAFRQSINPSLLNTLVNKPQPKVNTAVPPPNVHVPPPNVNVPPPNKVLDSLLPQGAGPHTMNLPMILQHPPPVPAPTLNQSNVVSSTSTPNASSSPYSQPPPSRPIPLMSIEHPPGFIPQISAPKSQ